MIADQMKQAGLYEGCHQGFAEGFAFIRRALSENLPEGRYEIDGERIFASIQEYMPKEEGRLEAHRRYIDIQCILCGRERMKCTPLSECTVETAFDPESDIGFYSGNARVGLELGEGDFAVFFPEDVHMPGLQAEEGVRVRKIVVKVMV